MLRRKWVVRFAVSAFLLWIGLALVWLLMPSPSRSDDCISWPSEVVNQHKELTRIYETERFFPASVAAPHPSIAMAHAMNRRHFALSFAIDDARQYLIINGQQWIALQNINVEERFSPPIIVTAPIGDAPSSSVFPPPWFDRADATLLSWSLSQETTVLTLRASWSENGPMEIWPDSESWEKRWLPPRGVRPLLTVSVIYSEDPQNNIVVSAPPLSLSPSDTYELRQKVFGYLFPACFILASVVQSGCCSVAFACVLAFKMAVLGIVLLFLAWLWEGRPRLETFVEGLKLDLRRIYCRGGRHRKKESCTGKPVDLDYEEKGHGMSGKGKG